MAEYFGKAGSSDLENWFRSYAQEVGHGTGLVVVDEDGENYIITNRHVVNQAGSVNVYFENPDGTKQSYFNCPILYVDNYMDLAVCQFPNRQRIFEVGMELDTSDQTDLTQVISAGFPGFGSVPLWQVATGNISNSRARIDENYDSLIQHSAPVWGSISDASARRRGFRFLTVDAGQMSRPGLSESEASSRSPSLRPGVSESRTNPQKYHPCMDLLRKR